MKTILAIAAVAGILARGFADRPDTVRVGYDVEFETTGPWENRGCPAVGGSDKLTGTIWGNEPFPLNQSNDYHGVLKRVTNVEVCDTRMLPSGMGMDCLISFVASGYFTVVLEVQAARVGYFKAKQAPGPLLGNTVSGNCDPAEMVQLRIDYGSGETAGSPGGQPIAIAVTDSIRVKTYPPNLADNDTWTLTVLRRLP